ncbi:MAG TPA: FecR family protein [Candidatus Goldiibacteriota bacterium]|nr:FecR family protein [Candidatus Goldiibacteriota bacterium]HPN64059.1 FecR family protein [Candidatus Goldiibacteriota bacterium]HRQ43692.1 FecR family protein [Candidatus Goldiibacteriota bacterium]
MKNLKRTVLTAAFLAFIALNISAASILSSVAVVSDYEGEAYVVNPGSKERVNASINMPIYEGASLKTLSDSYIEITFDNATMVRLESNTSLTLNELKRENSAKTVFNLLKGRMLAVVDKLRGTDSTFEIHTKMAVAAVKGTELAVEAGDNGSFLGVNEGVVEFFSSGNKEKVLVEKGKESKLKTGSSRPDAPSALTGMWKFERNFDNMREEIQLIRQLKQENGDSVIQYMINKKLKKEGKTEGESDTKLTLGGKDSKDTKNAQARIKQHFKNKLRGEMNTALKHSWEDLRFVNEEMKADLHLGKNMTDVKGRRVRMEEYVFRPAPNQVDMLSITLRDNRIDYLRASNYFNSDLPRIIPASAWQKSWASVEMPKFYRLEERVVLSNTSDRVETVLKYGYQDAVLGQMLLNNSGNPTYQESDPYRFAQPKRTQPDSNIWFLPEYEKILFVNGDVKEHQKFIIHRPDLASKIEASWIKMADDKTFTNTKPLVGNYTDKTDIKYADFMSTKFEGNPLIPEENYDAIYTSITTGGFDVYLAGNNPPDKILNSDLKWTELKRYNDGSWLRTEMYLIDDYGKIQQWNGTLRDFADILKYTNVEVNLASSEFTGGDIDIVSKLLWWTVFNPNK